MPQNSAERLYHFLLMFHCREDSLNCKISELTLGAHTSTAHFQRLGPLCFQSSLSQ